MANDSIKIAAVDFETYYDDECTIRTLGGSNYVDHPSFDAYLVAIATNTGCKYVGHPNDFDWSCISGSDWNWIAHNASFDELVYNREVEKGKLPAGNTPAVWHCTADMMAYMGFPRDLKQGVKYGLGEDISKATRDLMAGQRWEEMTEEFKQEVLDYAIWDSLYCLRLWEKFSDAWPEWERKVSRSTRVMGWRGVPVNQDKLEDAAQHLNNIIFEAEKNLPWTEEGYAPLAPTGLAVFCRKVGIEPPSSLAQDSEECSAWEDRYGDEYPWVGAMRTKRRGNSLQKKVEAMVRRVKPDGFMNYGQLYFGAHTGRESGADGVNMQNLPRGEMLGVNLREMIEAPKGHVFVSADLSQIEPRVLAWLTEDEEMLRFLRSGADLYETHARLTMGWKGTCMEQEDPETRRYAKARVLGLGYGCGVDKFVVVAKTLAGLEIDLEESRRVVEDFRRSNKKITDLWKELDRAISLHRGKDFCVELPSGRIMRYRSVQTFGGTTAIVPKFKSLMRVSLWGGKLTENVVQAAARDVFMHGVLLMEEAGVVNILRVHDEVLCLAKESEAEQVKATVEACMTTTPDWMPGLPLKAEAKILTKYTK